MARVEEIVRDRAGIISEATNVIERVCRFPDEQASTGLIPRSFVVISQSSQPRWLVPEKVRSALPVFRSWRPYGTKSRLQWQGVIAACSSNLLPLLPGVRAVQAGCNLSYWNMQLRGFSEEWEMLGHIGNPSPTQKAIFFFLHGGSIKAVAKVPLTMEAKAAILNEAAILNVIKEKQIVPEVLSTDVVCGTAAQSWIAGKPVSRKFQQPHLDFLLRLACNECSVRLSAFQNLLASEMENFDRPESERKFVKQAFDLLGLDEEWMAFTEHRDFAPWNVRRFADGRITLIDWEWAVEKSLPWQDVCRYFYIQDYLFREGKNVWEVLISHPLLRAYARKCNLTRNSMRSLTSYYLLRTLFEDYRHGEYARYNYTLRQIRLLFE